VRAVRLAALAGAIESRWSGSRVEIEPYRSPDDPLIRWWVYVFGLQVEEASAATSFGWGLAHELYGREPLPFFMTSHSGANARAILARLRGSKVDRATRTRPAARRTARRPLRAGSAARSAGRGRRGSAA